MGKLGYSFASSLYRQIRLWFCKQFIRANWATVFQAVYLDKLGYSFAGSLGGKIGL